MLRVLAKAAPWFHPGPGSCPRWAPACVSPPPLPHLLQRSLRALNFRTFYVSYFHFCPGLNFLREVFTSSLLEIKDAWSLDQLAWGQRHPLISPSRHGYTSPVRLALPAEMPFLVLSLLAGISRALSSILIKVPPAPPLRASSSHFLWEKKIQANLENAFCRGAWHHVQVDKAIFNCLYL